MFHDFTIVNVQGEPKFQTHGLKQLLKYITKVLSSENIKSTKLQHATLFLSNLKETVDSFNKEINKLKEEEHAYEMQIVKVCVYDGQKDTFKDLVKVEKIMTEAVEYKIRKEEELNRWMKGVEMKKKKIEVILSHIERATGELFDVAQRVINQLYASLDFMSTSLSKDLNIDSQNLPSFMQRISSLLSREANNQVEQLSKKVTKSHSTNLPFVGSEDSPFKLKTPEGGSNQEKSPLKKGGMLKLVEG